MEKLKIKNKKNLIKELQNSEKDILKNRINKIDDVDEYIKKLKDEVTQNCTTYGLTMRFIEEKQNKIGIKKAFTMIELVFVIVVLGILASVAVPKLIGTKEDAYIAKGKNQVAAIKNGINMRAGQNLLSGGGCGGGRYPVDLNETQVTSSNYDVVGTPLFDGILKEPIISSASDGGWMATGSYRSTEKDFSPETYEYRISNTKTVIFTYNNTNGTFTCNTSSADCLTLTK